MEEMLGLVHPSPRQDDASSALLGPDWGYFRDGLRHFSHDNFALFSSPGVRREWGL